MDEKQTSDAAVTGCFASISELRLAHLNVMERDASRDDHISEAELGEIRSLVARIQATGTVLDDRSERREAQGILDYWSSTLVSIGGADLRTWSQPRLAGFEAAEKRGETPADAERTKAELARLDDNARQLIRISALARQWRQSGKSVGYLLLGKALDDAKAFKGQDKDVDELVEASEEFITANDRKFRLIRNLLVALIIGLGFSYHFWKLNEMSRQNFEIVKAIHIAELKKSLLLQKLIRQNNQLVADVEQSNDRARRAENRIANMQNGTRLDNRPAVKQIRGPANIEFHTLPDQKSFDSGSDEDRLSAALDFSRRLRRKSGDPKDDNADRLALGKALVNLTNKDQFASLSPQGCHYLLFILSLIPVQYWNAPDWKDTRATLRQNLSALDVKQIILEPKSLQYLDAVRSYVGADK